MALPKATLAEDFPRRDDDALGQQPLEDPAHVHWPGRRQPQARPALRLDDTQAALAVGFQQRLHVQHASAQQRPQALQMLLYPTRGEQLGDRLLANR
ncbi:hypothetical protein D3C80_1049920 [compost metagenome]